MKDGFNIGIDAGALAIIDNGYRLDLAIGDFDSASESDYLRIKKNAKEIMKLNSIKNDTDFEHALKYIEKTNYKQIDVYGCLGGRQDHNFLNLKMLYQSNLNLCLYDEYHKIYCLDKGRHEILKEKYKYLSIFVFEEATLEIEGTFYKLPKSKVRFIDNYTISNEILDEKGIVTIYEGRILVIQSNDTGSV